MTLNNISQINQLLDQLQVDLAAVRRAVASASQADPSLIGRAIQQPFAVPFALLDWRIAKGYEPLGPEFMVGFEMFDRNVVEIRQLPKQATSWSSPEQPFDFDLRTGPDFASRWLTMEFWLDVDALRGARDLYVQMRGRSAKSSNVRVQIKSFSAGGAPLAEHNLGALKIGDEMETASLSSVAPQSMLNDPSASRLQIVLLLDPRPRFDWAFEYLVVLRN